MKKMAIAAILLIALILGAVLILRHSHAAVIAASDNSTGPVGSSSATWMNSSLSSWAPSQNSIYPLIFAPNIASVSYDNVYHTYGDPAAIAEDYQMLNQTGSQAITLFPGFDGWLMNDSYIIRTYNNVTSQIAAGNQILFIQDSSAEYYRTHTENWTEFTKNWITRDRVLAATYRPAYFEVIVEPQWYWPFMVNKSYALNVTAYGDIGQALNNTPLLNITDWINLTNRLISAVHNVSPSTKVGVSVPAGSLYHSSPLTKDFALKFLQNETKVNALSFISFDIYGLNDFNSTLKFLGQYGNGTKEVWIAQTWANPGINGMNPCSTEDSKFLVLDYYFALKIHAQGISPFFTDCFVSYNQSPNSGVQLTSYYQNRLPSFYEYQKIVASNKAGQPLNYTP